MILKVTCSKDTRETRTRAPKATPRSDTEPSTTLTDASLADASLPNACFADAQWKPASKVFTQQRQTVPDWTSTSTTVTLRISCVHLLPTNIFRTLKPQKATLSLGKSSTNLSGLSVPPVVTDLNINHELKVMVWTPNPSVFYPLRKLYS